MKQFIYLFISLSVFSSNSILAEDELTGDVKLACEAILCLSTGSPPNQCTPALNRFYSIEFKNFKDTLKGRINFLDLCPSSSEMNGYTRVLATGAGRCDNEYLISRLNPVFDFETGWYINGPFITIPAYCLKYYGHENTRLNPLPSIYKTLCIETDYGDSYSPKKCVNFWK